MPEVITGLVRAHDLAAANAMAGCLDDPPMDRSLVSLDRLTTDGELVIASSRHRSQMRNRVDCIARFAVTMAAAIKPPAPPRRKTRPGRGAVTRRLDSKKKHSQKKSQRRRPGLD